MMKYGSGCLKNQAPRTYKTSEVFLSGLEKSMISDYVKDILRSRLTENNHIIFIFPIKAQFFNTISG